MTSDALQLVVALPAHVCLDALSALIACMHQLRQPCLQLQLKAAVAYGCALEQQSCQRNIRLATREMQPMCLGRSLVAAMHLGWTAEGPCNATLTLRLMRPGLINAGSSRSGWLVVITMMRSGVSTCSSRGHSSRAVAVCYPGC